MSLNPVSGNSNLFVSAPARTLLASAGPNGGAPASAPMNVAQLQQLLVGAVQAEGALMNQWRGLSGGMNGDPLMNAIEAFAVGKMDPSLAAELNTNVHLGGGSPAGGGLNLGALPSSDALESLAIAKLDPTLAADLQGITDPFGIGGRGRGPRGLDPTQMIESLAFLHMDPALQAALGSVIQLNRG